MKFIVFMVVAIAGTMLVSRCPAQDPAPIESVIIGSWVAGELMMPQPPTNIYQSVKDISFGTNGIATWTHFTGGQLRTFTGHYSIIKDQGPPALLAIPTYRTQPGSGYGLALTNLSIDWDARFPTNLYGMVLKAYASNNEPLIFVRKCIDNQQGIPGDRRQSAPQPER